MKQTMIFIMFALFPLWFQVTMAQPTHEATGATNSDTAVRIVLSVDRVNGQPLTPRPVNEVLKDSIFNKDQPPESMLEGQITYYDPVPLMLVSSVYSRSPGRDNTQYTQVHLLPVKNFNHICPNPMKAFVKLSKQDNPHTFIILPGAYASWQRGSFNNQTISVLDKQFNDPNIIAFAGYLSPPFLTKVCEKIPWDSISIARDLYSRLGVYLGKIQANPETTGLIGFSGGGGLALIMLSEDASVSQNQEKKRLFGLGGTSFSPTLHGRTIFHNLDTVVSSIDHPRALTDWTNFGNLTGSRIQFWESSWKQLSESHRNDPEALLERAFNEFSVVDLEDILKAVRFETDNLHIHWGRDFPTRQPLMDSLGLDVGRKLSYMDVFINTGLRLDLINKCWNEHLGDTEGFNKCKSKLDNPDNLKSFYDNRTDIRPHLAAIDKPALIYFSQDDPVLSSYDGSGQPPVNTEILEEAQNNSNITVFNPKYGGHIGVLLDPIFEDLIRAFFPYKHRRKQP